MRPVTNLITFNDHLLRNLSYRLQLLPVPVKSMSNPAK